MTPITESVISREQKQLKSNTESTLSARDGSLWKCIKRQEVTSEEGSFIGYNHVFKLKHPYDKNYTESTAAYFRSNEQKLAFISSYPALEPPLSRAYDFLTNLSLKTLGFKIEKEDKPLNEAEGELTIPDLFVIEHNKIKLQSKSLRERLKFVASKGIASPREFLEYAIKGILVVSDGHEEVHDGLYHIASQVTRILNDESGEKQNRFQNFLRTSLEAIDNKRRKITLLPGNDKNKQNLKKELNFLEFYLSGSADSILTSKEFKAELEDLFSDIPGSPIKNLWKTNVISKQYPEFQNLTHSMVLRAFQDLRKEVSTT